MGVLPTLVDETEFRPTSIFHETVAVDVAIMVDPFEGALDVRPNRLNEYAVTRTSVVRTGEHDEKRSGVDAAVVTFEWNFAQRGHFASAGLVQHLARLRVLRGILRVRLRYSQVREDTARETGIKRHTLERGNNSVSSEFRAEPGNASVRIRSI